MFVVEILIESKIFTIISMPLSSSQNFEQAMTFIFSF